MMNDTFESKESEIEMKTEIEVIEDDINKDQNTNDGLNKIEDQSINGEFHNNSDDVIIEIKDEFFNKIKTASYDTLWDELSQLFKKEDCLWLKIYRILKEIRNRKLYECASCRNISTWVRLFAEKNHTSTRNIWNIFKAGRILDDYNERRILAGKDPINFNSSNIKRDDVVVSEDSTDSNITDENIEGLLTGKLSRGDIKAANAIRRKELKSRGIKATPRNGYERKKMQDKFKSKKCDGDSNCNCNSDNVNNNNNDNDDNDNNEAAKRKLAATAGDIVIALRKDDWIKPIENFEALDRGISDNDVLSDFKYKYYKRMYRTYTEVSIHTSLSMEAKKAMRIDLVAAENITSEYPSEILLHGIEIKVTKSDLTGDPKMEDYAYNVDYFWLAVPKDIEQLAIERADGHDNWGILSFDVEKKSLVIAKKAKLVKQMYRDRTFEMLLLIINGCRLHAKNDIVE